MTTTPIMPTQGGSYQRDEATGALIRLPDPDAPDAPVDQVIDQPVGDPASGDPATAPTTRKGGR